MQQRVETLHGMIGRVSRWLKPGKVPAGSELAHVDPVALVTPPEGLEVRNRLFFAPFNHSVALVNPPKHSPRQARDKHKQNSDKKERAFSRSEVTFRSACGRAHTSRLAARRCSCCSDRSACAEECTGCEYCRVV